MSDERPSATPPQPVPLERLIAACPVVSCRVISVFRFEVRRTRQVSRLLVWGGLVAFPVVIMGLFRYQAPVLPDELWGVVLYGLIPQVVCLLGLLLWVAPLLSQELEGRSWSYLAVRPGGKLALLFGKYLNGLCWTGSAACVGLSLAMLIGQPDVADRGRLYLVLCLLIAAACCGYGSVYAVIGTLFPRRAMVIAVGYMLIFEVLVSNIPAVVNQLTVQYRLFNILLKAMDWQLPSRSPLEVSQASVAFHCGVLVVYAAVNLFVAALVLRWREYATEEQP